VAIVNTRHVAFVVALSAVIAGLGYLRDPPWLARIESGLRGWETASDGRRYRWTDGHASFFVPASHSSLTIPLRATFGSPSDPPVRVSIAIDDRPADQIVLRDESWQQRRLRMPPPGSRSLRRIDIRVDRLRTGNRGVQLGEVDVR
jgi:hypothetical protein